MRFAIVALMTALGVAVAAPPARPEPARRLGPDEVRAWERDLDYLAREMPANHANLYHAMTREQFDAALAGLRARLAGRTREEVLVDLMRLVARVGDGHSSLSPWRDRAVGFRELPVALYRFADGYAVRAATREHAPLLGARVTAIGGVPIDSVESLVAPLVGRDNSMGAWMWTPLLLRMPEVLFALGLSRDPGRATFTLAIGGRSRDVTLAAVGPFPVITGDADKTWSPRPGWEDLRDRSPDPLWLSRADETCWFTYVPEGRLLYCQLNEIQERGEGFREFFARALAAADAAGAGRFVLDLRRNGGGNGYFNRAIVRAIVRSRFDEPGRLFVVAGRRTFSAAQMLLSDLEAWTHPTFVGEPSASRGNHYGDSRKLVMPSSGVTVRVSTLWWQYWDPRDSRPWIAPEIAAPLTVEAYAAGRDPALEAIARYVPEPGLAERLKPLVARGDSVGAWSALEAFRADPTHAWLDPSESLEALAGDLEGEGEGRAAALAERLRARLPRWEVPR